MPFSLEAWAVAALSVLGLVSLVWLVSLALRDSSIMDIAWGPVFVVAVGAAFGWAGADTPRAWLVLALVTIWAVRLAVHIYVRNSGKGEDARYAAWRDEAGAAWWWRSYLKVFLLQGAIACLVAMPLLAAVTASEPQALTPWDVAGLLLWLVGFGFEAVGDWQLVRFKADPANAGAVMDQGLWRYTRHPNYFGETVLWWGFALLAVALPGGFWTLAGPALMTWLIIRVSGVAMLERFMSSARPGYQDYVRRTSAFIPRRPKA